MIDGSSSRGIAMKLPRRKFLHLAMGATALSALSDTALALDYPTRPVRIIVGFPAGGAPDLFARLIGEWLSERLGRPFVIENRPGAATNIATELVVRAAPDGYTLLLVASANVISATLYPNLKFNLVRDIAPVASIGSLALVMMVNPSFPAKTVPEFIAYAKAHPGQINVASTGTGNLTYMAAELFKMMAGVDMVQVPARGDAAALSDLLSDRVQVMFESTTSSLGFVQTGKVRALAVTTATRSDILPGLPPVGDFVPGYEVGGVDGIGAPKDTPHEIIAALNKEINAGLTDSKMKARLAELGATVLVGSPTDFGKIVADEIEKWGKVIKFAGIKPD
jgi:tripartite-type tricarboxylate transporter receptor subunit TctC